MTVAIAIADLAMLTRSSAAAVVDRHVNPNQKMASLALYDVLALCMELCERCERDPDERAELERLFAAQPRGGQKRRYMERGSDIYVLVCRFAFTDTDRTNAMRYAAALREARKLQLNSRTLVDWLRNKGGVNALYFRRPLDRRVIKTKTLRLERAISVPRDEVFTVTLKWRDDNSFKVVAELPRLAELGP